MKTMPAADAQKLLAEIDHARRYLTQLEQAAKDWDPRKAGDAITNLAYGVDEMQRVRNAWPSY